MSEERKKTFHDQVKMTFDWVVDTTRKLDEGEAGKKDEMKRLYLAANNLMTAIEDTGLIVDSVKIDHGPTAEATPVVDNAKQTWSKYAILQRSGDDWIEVSQVDVRGVAESKIKGLEDDNPHQEFSLATVQYTLVK